mmetsp:Transcript_30768/g.101839  ORF Transcript_30768/g.101839 Transcript_30768/m.101839 type:complete len:95 (+) Transcript_30768:607-891(+)
MRRLDGLGSLARAHNLGDLLRGCLFAPPIGVEQRPLSCLFLHCSPPLRLFICCAPPLRSQLCVCLSPRCVHLLLAIGRSSCHACIVRTRIRRVA